MACDNAMDSISGLVPDNPERSGYSDSLAELLPSRRDGFRRFRRAFLTGFPLLVADLTVVIASLVIAISIGCLGNSSAIVSHIHAVLWFCGLYVIAGRVHGLYPGTGINAVSILRLQTHSMFYATVAFTFLAGLTELVPLAEPIPFFVGLMLCGVLLPFVRSSVRRVLVKFSWWGERAVIAGTTQNSLSIFEFLHSNAHLGLRPVGVVDDYPAEYWAEPTNEKIDFLGVTDELLSVCSRHDCHWVIATTGSRNREELQKYLTVCSLVPNLIVANDNLPLSSLWCTSFDAAGMAGFRVKDRLLHPMVRAAKRLIDITLSGILLLLVSPLLIGVAVCVKFASPGPIFFGHERIGRSGRKFNALKFRTMVLNADEVLNQYLKENESAQDEWNRNHKLLNDPRIIAVVGGLLRRWSLDELPQLWNVFRGDMSLVGPRPIVTDEISKYGSVFPLYVRVRPGLTGLWQVSGRNQTSYEARIQLDSYYVRSWSLWFDYYILLRTIKTVLTRQGSC